MAELESIGPERFRYLLETKQEISNLHITEEVIIHSEYFIEDKSITISNCTFDYEFKIRDNVFKGKLFFIDCTFHQRFLVINLNLRSLQFLKCTFNQYFTSKNINAFRLSFESCIFNLQKGLVIDQFIAEKLVFIKNEFTRDIQLIPKQVGLVSLAGGESNSSLTLSNRGRNNTIDELFLECNSNHKTDFLLRNLNIRYVHLKGELKDSTLSLSNIKIQIGVISYFFNIGNILINSIIPLSENSILVMKGANLGRAIISSTDFSKFNKIQISNSNLVDIVPVNIRWCSSKVIKSKNPLSDRKEIYRQLKIVANRNLDVPTKLLYHKYEMEAYLKIIKNEKGLFFDKLILQTNHISNNHGLNWFLAFCWLLGLSILWYTLTKHSLGQTEFAPELIGNEIGRFISFMNPTHHFDKVFIVENEMRTSNAILFDGISRVTGAYLLYQFVSAFRKFSKK